MKAVKLGFGGRVYLLVALLIVGNMAAAASYFLITQNQALKDALNQQARSLSESLAEGVRLGVVLEDGQFVRQVASGMLVLPNVLYIDVYLADGSILQNLGEQRHELSLNEQDQQIAEKQGFMVGDELRDESKEGYRNYIIPVYYAADSNQVSGYVRLGLSTMGITRKWKSTLTTTILATLILVVIGVALIYLPIRRIIRPIEQLSHGALRIGQGELDFKIAVDRDDEIGQLSDNFNAMASSLRQQKQEVLSKTFELEKSERKFRELFENIAQPLYINALDGRLIDCNPAMAELFGYTNREEMIRSVKSGGIIYAEPELREQVIRELLAKGEIKDQEVEFKRKDGSTIKTLVTSRVRMDDEGEAVGFEGMIHDVSEMRQLEEQLFHAQKMESIGTLAGGIAHDFNNLLTAIISSAEMARYKIDDRQSVEKYINNISSASSRAAELTKSLLGFARKGKMRIEDVDTAALIGEVNMLLSETIDRSVRISTDIPAYLWPVRGNPSQLHQVIVNLCVNARDAILENGGHSLNISLCNSVIDEDFVATHPGAIAGEYVRIDVSDDGGGIPDDVRERVFDPFFTTKAIGKGTGLGLASVYGIIKSHDGYIDLETEVGKGTTFHVYLPAIVDERLADSLGLSNIVPDAVVNQASSPSETTILFVDDEEILRLIAKEYLADCGYQVLLAENGVEAVKHMQHHHMQIDLVVADLIMPEMGGEEVLEFTKKNYPDIPVIIASGYSELVLQKKISAQNYDGYLEKPYELEHFGSLVKSMLP